MARFTYKNSLGAGWLLDFLDNEGSSSTPGYLGILYHNNTAERTYTFPNKSGTIPTTADVTSKVMTTLGDLIVGGASGATTRLAGSTSITPAVLMQTGSGTVSAAPVWAPLFTGTPSMDGTASVGTGTALALGNHVHPTDSWILSYVQARADALAAAEAEAARIAAEKAAADALAAQIQAEQDAVAAARAAEEAAGTTTP